VAGGYAPDGATVATVEVYDPAADAWAAGPDLPVAVNHAMAATLDGAVHVAGGYGGDRLPSRQAVRLEGDRWRQLAPLPEGRAAGGLVALDGRLYLVGGVGPGGLAAGARCRHCRPRATASGWWRWAGSCTCWRAAPGRACTPPPPTRRSTWRRRDTLEG